MANKIKEFATQLQNEIPGFIAFSICEIKSGKCVFSMSSDPEYDIEYITLCNVDFVRAKLNTVRAAKIADSVKNIIVNLENQFHIIDITSDNEFFFYIAVSNKEANLAIVMARLASCKNSHMKSMK